MAVKINFNADSPEVQKSGILALSSANQTGAICARTIHIDKGLGSMDLTAEKFNKPEAISDYYKVSIGDIVKLINQPFSYENPQRQMDELCITSFLSKAKLNYSEGLGFEYNVIDFGGAFGSYFYQSKIFKDQSLGTYYVCDLPCVQSFGDGLKESLISDTGVSERNKKLISKKLRFESSLGDIDCDPEIPLFVICNGVFMHLSDPAAALLELFNKKPSALFLGNNFEQGSQLESFLASRGHDEDYVVASGAFDESRGNEHCFAINKLGTIMNAMQEAAAISSGSAKYNFTSFHRDFFSFKLFAASEEDARLGNFMIDQERNLNYCAWLDSPL